MVTSEKADGQTTPPAIVKATADGTMTVVELGQVRYHVHKALLVFHSEYFRKALQGPWKEADEGIVRLHDVGTAEFNIFVHWLYTQQLPTDLHEMRQICAKEDDLAPDLALVKAYAFGDRLLAFTFRRAINNHIVEGYHGFVDPSIRPEAYVPAVQWAFKNIPSDRPLLQFLVNGFCEHWYAGFDNDDDFEAIRQLPISFTMRALRRYSLVKFDRGKGCFMEHATEDGKQGCRGVHPKHNAEHDGYGYVGEMTDYNAGF